MIFHCAPPFNIPSTTASKMALFSSISQLPPPLLLAPLSASIPPLPWPEAVFVSLISCKRPTSSAMVAGLRPGGGRRTCGNSRWTHLSATVPGLRPGGGIHLVAPVSSRREHVLPSGTLLLGYRSIIWSTSMAWPTYLVCSSILISRAKPSNEQSVLSWKFHPSMIFIDRRSCRPIAPHASFLYLFKPVLEG